MTRRRVRKILGVLLAIAVIAVALLAVTVRSIAHRQMVTQLQNTFGGDVQIESLSLGVRWHEAHGVLLRGETSGQTWLQVEQARIELPLSDVIRGHLQPRQVILTGVEATVRLDEQNRLLEPRLQLKQTGDLQLPSIKVMDARIVVEQPGQPPISCARIDASLEPTTARWQLTGSVGDSPLGSFSWAADFDTDDQVMRAEATVDSIQFDTSALLAVLHSRGWATTLRPEELVRAHGRVLGNVQLTVGKDLAPRYRAELDMTSVQIAMPDGETLLRESQGELVIENGTATIRGFQGRIGSGRTRGSGSLDFQASNGTGALNLQFSQVTLPLDFGTISTPSQLTGVAQGRVAISLQRKDGQWVVRGSGAAELEEAVFDGVAIDTLATRFELDRWRFDTPLRSGATGQLQVDFVFNELDMDRLAAKFLAADSPLVDQISGVGSLAGQLQVPLDSVEDPVAYTANMEFSSESMGIAKTTFRPLAVQTALRRGRLELGKATVPIVAGGSIELQGDIALVTPGDSTLQLVLDQLPLDAAKPYLGQTIDWDGVVSGTVALTLPDAAWREPHRWQVSGKVSSNRLTIGAQTVTGLSAMIRSADGHLMLSQLRGEWSKIVCEGSVTCGLESPFSFEARLRCPAADLTTLSQLSARELPVAVAGTVAGEARLSGAFEPFQWTGSGRLAADSVQLGEITVSDVLLPWSLDARQLVIHGGAARAFDGDIKLDGTIPLSNVAATRIQGEIQSLSVDRFNRYVAQEAIALQGSASGRYSAHNLFSPDELEAELHFAGIDALVKGIEVQQSRGRIDVHQQEVRLELGANLLGGTCAVLGSARVDPADWIPRRMRGKLTLRAIDVKQLWPKIGQQQKFGRLMAVGNAEFTVEKDSWPSAARGRGELKLSGVRWGAIAVARELAAKVNFTTDDLVIEDARAQMGRGHISGKAKINRASGRGEFVTQIEGVPLRSLVGIAPELARDAQGSVDGELTGSFGQRWDASGNLRLQRGRLSGVPMTAIRVPVRIRHAPDSGRTQLTMALQSGRIASGRAKGRCDIIWRGRVSIEGRGELNSADLRPLARAVPGLSDALHGRITAAAEWKSDNLRSLEEFTGKFDVRLQQCPAMLLPGLGELKTALGAPSPGAVTFRETVIQGEMQRGVLSLKQMTMQSQQARVWIDGSLDVRGTLDFNVVADPGSLSTINLVAATVNPISLLRRRLLYLHLGGSLRSPIVQPRTDQFLAQEMVLFFVPVISIQ